MHPCRDVSLAVQHPPDVDAVGLFDVEDDAGVPLQRPCAKARQVELAHVLAAGAVTALTDLLIHEGLQGVRGEMFIVPRA